MDVVKLKIGEGVVRNPEHEGACQDEKIGSVVVGAKTGCDGHDGKNHSVNEEQREVGSFVPQLVQVEDQQSNDQRNERD